MPTGLRGWRILYWSTSATGAPVAVSGTVLAPVDTGPVPADRRIIAFAHPTVGMGDQCAPSKTFAQGSTAALAFVPLLAQSGALIVATDYEGLGTAGDAAYLVGRSEGHGVLDSARAAQQLGLGTSKASTVLIWGHSQGGGAAAWAAELAPVYSPDLHVIGAMLGAPVGELSTSMLTTTNAGDVTGFAMEALAGFKAAYPELPLDELLTTKGREVMAKVRVGCSAEVNTAVAGLTIADLITPALGTNEAWAKRLAENNPAGQTTSVPLFIYHGGADTTVPPEISAAMLAKYCKLGVTVQRRVYPGKGHGDVVQAAFTDLITFATARWAGTNPIDSCP
jgi:pimeloyl-ACP methyl ester carboxylesterase